MNCEQKFRTFPLLLTFLLFSSITFSQALVDEFGVIGGCDEGARHDNLLITLNETKGSRGLVVIYTGEDMQQIGNVKGYIRSVKHYYRLRGYDEFNISFAIAKGKTKFLTRLWIIGKNDKLPKFEKFDPDFSSLSGEYLFSKSCLGCEPMGPTKDFSDRSWLGKILKENPEYSLRYEVTETGRWKKRSGWDNPKKIFKDLQKSLSKNHGISKNRISLLFKKKRSDEEDNIWFATEKYIIVPGQKSATSLSK